MKKNKYSSEYMKGYERGLNDKLSSESLWEYLNLDRLLNTSDKDAQERERGYRDGRREKNSKKWEYITGYERGVQGKPTAQSAGEFLDPKKVLFGSDTEKKERERGFKVGRKELTEKKWL